MANDKKEVKVAVGDVGAWQYFAPTIPRLKELYDVQVLADPAGAAIKELQKAGIDHRASDGNIFQDDSSSVDLGNTAMVLCGTAGKAFGLWRTITERAHESDALVGWFGDFYSSGCELQVADIDPDFMATFDDTTRSDFLVKHPKVPRDHVEVLGNPSFDAIASLNVPEMAKSSREKLGLKDDEVFVLYSGSSFNQFDLEGETLDNLIPWVKAQGVRFAFRFHPADSGSDNPEVKEKYERLRQKIIDGVGPLLVDTSELKGLELSAAVAGDKKKRGFLVTDYSTEGVKPALAGIKVAFLMLPTSRDYMQKNKGGVFPFFSILKQDGKDGPLALVAGSAGVVPLVLNRALEPAGNAEVAKALQQKRYQVLCDGKAGERVLAFIQEVVSP